MLELKNVTTEIAGTTILRDVSFSVSKGSMVGLIGRNGAGKTTSLRSIMGLIKPKAGQVLINGEDMTNQGSYERAGMSIGYMPEDRRLVPDLTVEENIMAPAWACQLGNAEARLAWIYEMMPEVESFSDRRALQLSGGQQKLVALARAMMTGTNLLLLDEPFEGVAPALSRRLASVLSTLKDEGLTVLLSESDQSHSADLVDKAFQIERGSVEPIASLT
ncbi:ATP-binding cassette domain-containing protein [Marinobacter flavimaris]|jgi:branched-chain amino acid transport system ATP-binding protein|uniref:ATP-binding cassette domain-containing protein n=1 Tax=Marinobacter flavimaris TaxID=262076 RepID=A0A3D8H7P7_9GAMM|nr:MULTISPECIES: ATP-binding cassette domain-containing protein [Marinobacter]MCP4063681.1 ATP-binding cassette domain-containing protein [Gammaproteobacteria bacterium]MAK51867.1 ABC transporter ATP-binding protein [Marinobacter sp.]MAM52018.1 ABC transporter ATP-binding protein [Marinobacter sp.]MBI47307.1 ABC transporter ATP-binding protein [Marinobacter sp.]PPI82287.1 ABC transporter ATP-binding protein [Marinobacter flavimaris]|tara:strand:+ start:550 stop:1206 length:657 start_codon:yes stop_codon:yes gene_type:complete